MLSKLASWDISSLCTDEPKKALMMIFKMGTLERRTKKYNNEGWETAEYKYKNNLRHGISKNRIKINGKVKSYIKSYQKGRKTGWQVNWEDGVIKKSSFKINGRPIIYGKYVDVNGEMQYQHDWVEGNASKLLQKEIKRLAEIVSEMNYDKYKY